MRPVPRVLVATLLIVLALIVAIAAIPTGVEAFTYQPFGTVTLQPTELGKAQKAKGLATLYDCPGGMTVLEVKVVGLAVDGTQLLVVFTLSQNPADPLMGDWFTMDHRHAESYLWDLPLITVTPGFPTVTVVDGNFDPILTGTF